MKHSKGIDATARVERLLDQAVLTLRPLDTPSEAQLFRLSSMPSLNS